MFLPMRDDDGWAALLLADESAAEGALAGTAALLGSTLSSVGTRSRIVPLSREGAGWCAALVTKACAEILDHVMPGHGVKAFWQGILSRFWQIIPGATSDDAKSVHESVGGIHLDRCQRQVKCEFQQPSTADLNALASTRCRLHGLNRALKASGPTEGGRWYTEDRVDRFPRSV